MLVQGMPTQGKISKIRVRDFRNFNEEAFQNDISAIDISSYIHSPVNEIFIKYNRCLVDIINKHAPYRCLSRKETRWKDKPWINYHLRKRISLKNKL